MVKNQLQAYGLFSTLYKKLTINVRQGIDKLECVMSELEENLQNAKVLLEADKADEARLALLDILHKEPDNPTALLMLAGAYFYAQMYEEAELVYKRLIEAEPGSGMLSIAMFNTLWKLDRHEEAFSEIRRFISKADKVQERETLETYAKIIKTISA